MLHSCTCAQGYRLCCTATELRLCSEMLVVLLASLCCGRSPLPHYITTAKKPKVILYYLILFLCPILLFSVLGMPFSSSSPFQKSNPPLEAKLTFHQPCEAFSYFGQDQLSSNILGHGSIVGGIVGSADLRVWLSH